MPIAGARGASVSIPTGLWEGDGYGVPVGSSRAPYRHTSRGRARGERTARRSPWTRHTTPSCGAHPRSSRARRDGALPYHNRCEEPSGRWLDVVGVGGST